MKRKILCTLAITALVFVGCKKPEPSVSADPGTCTLTGTVQAALDLSNDTVATAYSYNLFPENVPDGTRLTFIIDSKDLDHNPDPAYNYQDLTYSTTVSGGTYSIDLPAISTPLSVDVYFDEFNYDQVQYPNGSGTVSYKFFQTTVTVGGLTDGAKLVQNFMFSW